jgi:hypothetical protein
LLFSSSPIFSSKGVVAGSGKARFISSFNMTNTARMAFVAENFEMSPVEAIQRASGTLRATRPFEIAFEI